VTPISIRWRILKREHIRAEPAHAVGYTHLDPLEDTETGAGYDRGGRPLELHPSRSVEDTETRTDPTAHIAAIGYTHLDPLEDTETRFSRAWPLGLLVGLHPSRLVGGY
ncbi:MAG: hypothetical protein JW892_08820, partial [Anaerolineae bacterium]|nr:hypothetical protein [Anaerolineae bacterium]